MADLRYKYPSKTEGSISLVNIFLHLNRVSEIDIRLISSPQANQILGDPFTSDSFFFYSQDRHSIGGQFNQLQTVNKQLFSSLVQFSDVALNAIFAHLAIHVQVGDVPHSVSLQELQFVLHRG